MPVRRRCPKCSTPGVAPTWLGFARHERCRSCGAAVKVHWLFETAYTLLAVPALALVGLYMISVPAPLAAMVFIYALLVWAVFLLPGFLAPLQAKGP